MHIGAAGNPGSRRRVAGLSRRCLAIAPGATPCTLLEHIYSLPCCPPPSAEVLPHLVSLRRLEVTLQGAGATFPRLGARRLEALTVHCADTASIHTLLSLAVADEVGRRPGREGRTVGGRRKTGRVCEQCRSGLVAAQFCPPCACSLPGQPGVPAAIANPVAPPLLNPTAPGHRDSPAQHRVAHTAEGRAGWI